MEIEVIIGSLAAACTTLAFLPQAIKVIQTRHTKDLSLAMYVIFTLGVFLWLMYGLMTNDWPIIVANLVTCVLAAIILGMKIVYK